MTTQAGIIVDILMHSYGDECHSNGINILFNYLFAVRFTKWFGTLSSAQYIHT